VKKACETPYHLDLFCRAANWKAYWARHVAPHISGRVLEVGAGMGANARLLAPDTPCREWVCLEPELLLQEELTSTRARIPAVSVVAGTLECLQTAPLFDTILYMDVLEHIEDDARELRQASAMLRPDGRLVVLAPAHPWLYTAFDKRHGHFRRYTRRTLTAAAPDELELVCARYLDSAGLLASAGNAFMLRQASAGEGQVRFWDRVLVPISRVLDPILGYRAGKSLLAVWRRRE
jgi:SAM-dependent methyltransferase